MGEEGLDHWASLILSTCLSSKAPLTPQEIYRDTKMLEGREIPFRQLGFHSFEEMLRKIATVRVIQQGGRTVVQPLAKESTSHLQSLIRSQKTKTKKKSRTLPFSRYNTPRYNNRPPVYRNQSSYNNQSRVPNTYPTTHQQNNRYSAPSKHQTLPPKTEPPVKPPSTPVTPVTTPTTPILPATPTSLRQPTTTQRPSIVASPVTTPTQPKTVTFSNAVETPQKPSPVQQRLAAVQKHVAPAPIPEPVIPTVPKVKSLDDRLKAAKNGAVTPFVFKTDQDPRLLLNKYALQNGYPPPEYTDKSCAKSKTIYSSVKIDKDKKYSSYPQEAKTKEEAEKIAAKRALDDLLAKDKLPRVVTTDKRLMIQRIVEMVEGHQSGLYENGVVEAYTTKYNEKLPNDWLKSVENIIKVDKFVDGRQILFLQKNAPREIPQLEVQGPEILKYSDIVEIFLNVIVVYSTTEVWGIIIDENCSGKLAELAEEMRYFYNNNNSLPEKITPGSYYTVFETEWHRVRCEKYDEESNKVSVFFIDRGDEDQYDASCLRPLMPKFCLLPAQAVRLSMYGLEMFEDFEEALPVLEEMLLDKSIVVINKLSDVIDEVSDNVLSAELWLSSDKPGGIDINLTERIRDSILKLADPKFYMTHDPEKQPRMQQARLSSVSTKAIYVQLASKGKKQLDRLMEEVTKQILESRRLNKIKSVLKFDSSKTYLLKCDNWYRVQLREINDQEAKVFCVDEGCEMTVKKTDLILLYDLFSFIKGSELLALYPHQAVQVQLQKFTPELDQKMIIRLRELAPKTEVFYMKVVGENNMPVVLFIKRTKDNLLGFLNDTLIIEQEMLWKDDNNNAKNMKSPSLGVKSNFPLNSPPIPLIGSEFKVLVTMAAHPTNFTVQPLSSAKNLQEMMANLARVCETYTGPALTLSNIKAGSMYAAKYVEDGKWYRGYVANIINKTVIVYYCDYGDFKAVSMDQLQPLDKEFLRLPYQAIKAKVYGISPLNGDWSVADSLKFMELTVNKIFNSKVKSIEPDSTHVSEIIVGLELTIAEKNESISKIFLDEMKAKLI